jgi:hypothetical protein
MYAKTSAQLESLTLANFLCAELGFLGPMTDTLRQTHLLNGEGLTVFLLLFSLLILYCNAGALDLYLFLALQFLIS